MSFDVNLFCCRGDVWVQGFGVGVRVVFGVRDAVSEGAADQRLPLRGDEHLQRGGAVPDHGASDAGDREPAGRGLRLRLAGDRLLLLPQHGLDFYPEG